ncbi:unnamed protein product [Rotaria sordida]|uniref:Uncharacterized protein n=1 Tax=Rotaria sordida TaxID=392033 RepID=A0A814W7Q0_9BILA|nr:unnamed protein product [Rotaria sordida]
MQRPPRRFVPIRLSSYDQEYPHQEIENGDRYQTSKSERSNCCSKQCLIGLCVGLAIGVALVIIIAVPVGVVGFTRKSTSSLGTISSTPNWIGTFLMDNACDTSSCCCLTNQVTLSQVTNNQLQITGSITGLCTIFSSPITLIQSMPTGFQVFITWSGETIRLQLGQDNSYISFVNIKHGKCSTTGLRTSYSSGSMKSMNLGLVMFILSIIISTMI